jgi:hypothetical protein
LQSHPPRRRSHRNTPPSAAEASSHCRCLHLLTTRQAGRHTDRQLQHSRRTRPSQAPVATWTATTKTRRLPQPQLRRTPPRRRTSRDLASSHRTTLVPRQGPSNVTMAPPRPLGARDAE